MHHIGSAKSLIFLNNLHNRPNRRILLHEDKVIRREEEAIRFAEKAVSFEEEAICIFLIWVDSGL